MVDQVQVIANLDQALDKCRRILACPDIYDLPLVRRLYEQIDELLDQRSALTHAHPDH